MVCVSLSSRHDALWKLENQSSCLFYLLKFIPWSIVFFVGKGRSSAEVEVDLGASMTSLVAQTVKQLSTMGETWVWKSPWRRKWQPTPVLLPWKSHGQRSLVQASIHGVAKSRAWLSDFTFFLYYWLNCGKVFLRGAEVYFCQIYQGISRHRSTLVLLIPIFLTWNLQIPRNV